jgi:hypothetical protein
MATCGESVAVDKSLISVGGTDVGVEWIIGLATTVGVSCVMEVALIILVGDGEIEVG